MKFIKILAVVIAASIGTARAQFVKAELQVSGLTCAICSKATEKSLRTLPFISDIKPDLNKNIFNITFKANAPVDLQQIGKKVQNAGFFVNMLKATVDFNKVKVSNNSFTISGDTYKLVNAGTKDLAGLLPVTVVNKGFAPASVTKKYNAPPVTGTSKVYQLAI